MVRAGAQRAAVLEADFVNSDEARWNLHMRVHESGHAIVGRSVGLTIGEPTANYRGAVPDILPNDMT